jgi:anti-sigma factor RsiW
VHPTQNRGEHPDEAERNDERAVARRRGPALGKTERVMTCDEFRAQLHDYFHGSLAAERRVEIDRHASQCGPCGELMRIAKEISCKDFVAFLDRYLDGELEAERKAVFERHLAICPDCTAYLDSYRKTMSLSAQALRGSAAGPPAMPDELVRAILAARRAH